VKVPFLDLKAAYAELREQIDEAVVRSIGSGWYVGGPELDRFERDFAAYTGASYAVGVANGLDALHLALRSLGVGAGDEVIVASNSYIATVLAVTLVGATPVLVEPDPLTHNLDPMLVEAGITPRTRVILPTHLYGQPAELDPLLALADRHGLKLLEDAAQAHGAAYRGRRVGAHGHAVAWSFYPSKNLGALGDAGAVTTNNPALADSIRTLGNYGSRVRYVNDVQGLNSRLDPLQAAVLDAKLVLLDEWNGRRAAIARKYLDELSGCDLDLPFVPDWALPAWHLFVVQSDHRDGLQGRLADAGVQTLIHYPIPPHLQQAYAEWGYGPGSFPVAERLAARVLSLPIGPHLSDEQVDHVIAAVKQAA
jgi:dTDP-4-amino-4,6-dideoxygalactose transaminase